jgi:hypothetical protein
MAAAFQGKIGNSINADEGRNCASALLDACKSGLGALNEKLDDIFKDAASLDAFAQSLGLDAGEFDATQLQECDRNKLKNLVRTEVIKCHGEKNPSPTKLTLKIANAFMGLYIYISARFHSNKLFGVNIDTSVRAANCVSLAPGNDILGTYKTVRAIGVPSGKDSMLWAFEAGSNPENLGTNGDARLIARDRTIPKYRKAVSEALGKEAEDLRQRGKGKEADELERRAKSGDFKPKDMCHLSKYLRKDIAIVVQGKGSKKGALLCTKDGKIETVTPQDNEKRLQEALGSGYAIFIGKDGHCSGLKNDPAFAEETKEAMDEACEVDHDDAPGSNESGAIELNEEGVQDMYDDLDPPPFANGDLNSSSDAPDDCIFRKDFSEFLGDDLEGNPEILSNPESLGEARSAPCCG